MSLIKYIIENDLSTEDFTGEVCWWSEKNGNGILLVGEENHEVYIDISVLQGDFVPKRKQLLEFNYNTKILDCTCGMNVRLIA